MPGIITDWRYVHTWAGVVMCVLTLTHYPDNHHVPGILYNKTTLLSGPVYPPHILIRLLSRLLENNALYRINYETAQAYQSPATTGNNIVFNFQNNFDPMRVYVALLESANIDAPSVDTTTTTFLAGEVTNIRLVLNGSTNYPENTVICNSQNTEVTAGANVVRLYHEFLDTAGKIDNPYSAPNINVLQWMDEYPIMAFDLSNKPLNELAPRQSNNFTLNITRNDNTSVYVYVVVVGTKVASIDVKNGNTILLE